MARLGVVRGLFAA